MTDSPSPRSGLPEESAAQEARLVGFSTMDPRWEITSRPLAHLSAEKLLRLYADFHRSPTWVNDSASATDKARAEVADEIHARFNEAAALRSAVSEREQTIEALKAENGKMRDGLIEIYGMMKAFRAEQGIP